MQSSQLQGMQEEGEISEQWHCRSANNFERISQVGEGTYAYVYKVRDKQSGEFFAMKKIKMESEKEGFPITALREIKILKNCKHPNIIGLKEIVTTKAKEDSRNSRGSVYLVIEYMDHDLAGILAKDSKIDLSIPQIKCLTKQMLSAIQYLHANNIIHRDIKGANLLLNNKGELKLGDFGLARHYQPNNNALYTNKVITLWYRPPELLLGQKKYTTAIDMWSVGCMFGELLIKEALFQGDEKYGPGKQLGLIFQTCGTPSEENWPDIVNLPLWQEQKPAEAIERNLNNKIQGPKVDQLALDLLDKLLQLDPSKRFTADQALEHPYFKTEPLPCQLSELPKIEQELHELIVKDRRRPNMLKRNYGVQKRQGETNLTGEPGVEKKQRLE